MAILVQAVLVQTGLLLRSKRCVLVSVSRFLIGHRRNCQCMAHDFNGAAFAIRSLRSIILHGIKFDFYSTLIQMMRIFDFLPPPNPSYILEMNQHIRILSIQFHELS